MQRKAVHVTHLGKGILQIDSRRRIVLSHINAGKQKAFRPSAREPVTIPLTLDRHANKGLARMFQEKRADIARKIKLIKLGRGTELARQSMIAHHGNQDIIYGALERLAKNGKGNISVQGLERHGVNPQTIRDIETGKTELEISFDSNGHLELGSGTLKVRENPDNPQRKRLSEEELARLLLSLNQISAVQILRRNA